MTYVAVANVCRHLEQPGNRILQYLSLPTNKHTKSRPNVIAAARSVQNAI